jgi:hypothetical protein
MTNWLQRAKIEISQNADFGTANTDDRSLTAVLAVAIPVVCEISRGSIGSNGSAESADLPEIDATNDAPPPMTQEDETAIRAWLAHIGETDPATIADVLDKCRADAGERQIVLRWADEAPRPASFYDDRRRCDQCANLTVRGLCLAAWRGEIVASRNFEPVRDLPQRCIGYLPKATESDQRTGRERWPGLIQKESKHAYH